MITKKKQKEIERLSFIGEVILEYYPEYNKEKEGNTGSFLDNPPDFWTPEEKDIFDSLTDLEMKLKSSILEILNK